MSLKHTFRYVFYHKKLTPLRLWDTLKDLDSRISNVSNSEAIEALEARVSALEEASKSEG